MACWRLLIVVVVIARSSVAVEFVDMTEEAGIAFRHIDGRSGRKYFVETLGSGAALFDYDNDHDPDLYLVNGASLPGYIGEETPMNRLYRNDNGRFTDVTERAGVGDTGYGHGVCVGDYDNDGDLDLYVTNLGRNTLYRNNGDGTFADVTDEAGVASPLWSSSAAFADYDLDGDLDLYVCNYISFDLDENPWCGLKEEGVRAYCAPDQFDGQPDALFRNEGNGRFVDVTRDAGLFRPHGKGLGVAWGDYDNDGFPDIYVANDSTENFLFHNERDGTFAEVGFVAGVALGENGDMENGMGTAWGDYDNDGWLDLTVTNYADQTNTIYHNDRDGFFTDVTAVTKTGYVTNPFLGWATEFVDFDNDGFLDLFVANGHLHDNLAALRQDGSYPQRNLLFRNTGDGAFVDVSKNSGDGMALIDVSRGAAFADIDGDGDLDALVVNLNGRPRLLRNDGGNANHWLIVGLRARDGSRGAIGARVALRAGGRRQIRDARSGSGYLSQNDPSLHFGLALAELVESIEVRWPDGDSTVLTEIRSNQRIEIIQGER